MVAVLEVVDMKIAINATKPDVSDINAYRGHSRHKYKAIFWHAYTYAAHLVPTGLWTEIKADTEALSYL